MAEEVRQVVKAQVQGKKSDDTFEDIITDDGGRLQVYDPKVFELLGVTAYGQRTALATNADGTDWVDLLDMTALTKPEEIWGITLTIAGGWTGLCQMRIIEAAGGTKIFPFADYAEQDTDFISAVEWMFPAPIVVPVASGYKVQFRSSGADGAGKTCALTELAVIKRG